MKKFLLIFLLPFFSFTSKQQTTIRLSGYFLVYCFNPTDTCPCGLDIASTDLIASKNEKNETCLCDGNYYKNFGLLRYVRTSDLDLGKMDDFNYQAKLDGSGKEEYMFLSTNKNILRDAFSKDSTLVHDSTLVKQVESDSTTAELIYKAVDGAKLNFPKGRIAYTVLLKGEVTVLRLQNSPKTIGVSDGMGHEQYLFLNDPANHIELVKVLKDPF